MFHKALWFHNFKHTSWILSILAVLYIIHLPFQAILQIETWKDREFEYSQVEGYTFEIFPWDVLQIFSVSISALLIAIILVALASILVGQERNSSRDDFILSLPISRRAIFLAKWMYGTVTIIVFHSLSFLAAYLILYMSEYREALNILSQMEILWSPLISLVMIYTFSLFIGTITGEMIAQVLLTVVFSFLPLAIFYLLFTIIEVHTRIHLYEPRFLAYISPYFYITNTEPSGISMILLLCMISLFLLAGVMLYEKNHAEYNGEFLVFKQLTFPFLILFTVASALFGGMIVSSLAPWTIDALRIISYWIGFVFFLIFALLFIRKFFSSTAYSHLHTSSL